MRFTTRVWAKFQSTGHPESTQIVENEPLNDIVFLLTAWLGTVTMGSKIVVTLARSRGELEAGKVNPGVDPDMRNLLEQMMAKSNSAEEESQ